MSSTHRSAWSTKTLSSTRRMPPPISSTPPTLAVPRPALILVLEDSLVAVGGEASKCLRMLALGQTARELAQRPFVDLLRAQLEAHVGAADMVEHAGRRRVPQVAVLRAHHRRDH